MGAQPLAKVTGFSLSTVGSSGARVWLTDCRSVSWGSKYQGPILATTQHLAGLQALAVLQVGVGWPERYIFFFPRAQKGNWGSFSVPVRAQERNRWMAFSKGVPDSREFNEGTIRRWDELRET